MSKTKQIRIPSEVSNTLDQIVADVGEALCLELDRGDVLGQILKLFGFSRICSELVDAMREPCTTLHHPPAPPCTTPQTRTRSGLHHPAPGTLARARAF